MNFLSSLFHVSHVPMIGRDSNEKHRMSTPLELFFDLVYVIAIFNIASGLHHALVETHSLSESIWLIVTFFQATFFLWWSWMNYTWFASAYATDDFYFKILTFFQIFGALLFATNVSQFFWENPNFLVSLIGFWFMRWAMILQWLRASKSDTKRKETCRRYAFGLLGIQILWTIFTPLLGKHILILGLIFIFLELCIPIFAETKFQFQKNNQIIQMTPWHPHHIVERYWLMAIIMLGEGLWGTFRTLSSLSQNNDFLAIWFTIIYGGIVTAVVFTLWWSYFQTPWAKLVSSMPTQKSWIFGYWHYFIFVSFVAIGVGLDLFSDIVQNYYKPHSTHAMSLLFVSSFMAISTAVYIFSHNEIRNAIAGEDYKKCRYTPWISSIFLIISVILIAIGYTGIFSLLTLLFAIIIYIQFHTLEEKHLQK